MSENDVDQQVADPGIRVSLPSGQALDGYTPVVVLGPNGSGKTRLARELVSDQPIEFVNALRNTRVAQETPSMALSGARNQLTSFRAQARSQHWELMSDFDSLLAKLRAEDAEAAIEYRDRSRAGQALPETRTSMERIRTLWSTIFPGRELFWRDSLPIVRSTVRDEEVEYSANQMSDGEKAALYMAGKVLDADSGVMVIDEPETHFHSLLAVRLWDALERARPDLRFIYVTHDLPFALSRNDATFVLASPRSGLTTIELGDHVTDEVSEAILGAASFSFYARRIVICEGGETSADAEFFRAWFIEPGTVVRPVGSSDMVLRCTSTLRESGLVTGADVTGVVDRDYHPDGFLDGLPGGVVPLACHEIESLYCVPAVVEAVAAHLGREWEPDRYADSIRSSITTPERHRVVLERWKRRMEPRLQTLLASVQTSNQALDDVVAALPGIFDHTGWEFAPETELTIEKDRVEEVVPDGELLDVLQLMPGKPMLAVAASFVGLKIDDYRHLVNNALAGVEQLEALGVALGAALEPHLPSREALP